MTILAGIESWRFRWGLGIYLNGELTPDGVIGYGASITYCRSPGPTEIVLGAVDTSGNVSAPSNPLLFPADRLPAASRLHYGWGRDALQNRRRGSG